MARALRLGDVTRELPSGRPRARLGADRGRAQGLRIVVSGDYKDVADPTCAPFELVACDVFITEATFGLPVFRHGDPAREIAKLLRSVALFPERTHLVGAYALGKAQRVIALHARGRLRPADLSARRARGDHALLRAHGFDLGEVRPVRAPPRRSLRAPSRSARRRRCKDVWTRRFPDPVTASRRAGCGSRRARASAASSCRW